ncbi:Activator of 90 kDa heat shock protein ATPase-like protein [Diplonema papillatum]|nr:Activator of 90 kDa heat shock protein ATPase-like protein [Diplonema papillatum]
MARVNEGDPRWNVRDLEDGRNVNAWHWEEKDVTGDAKKLFTQWLTNRTVSDVDESFGRCTIRLLVLRGEIEGESIVINRKRKKGCCFDFTAAVEWHGEAKDKYGYESADAHGLLKFNVDQETMDDFPVEVTVESLRLPATDVILAGVRKEAVPALRSLVRHFFEALRCKHDPVLRQQRDADLAREREQIARAARAADEAALLAAAEQERELNAKLAELKKASVPQPASKEPATPVPVEAVEAVQTVRAVENPPCTSKVWIQRELDAALSDRRKVQAAAPAAVDDVAKQSRPAPKPAKKELPSDEELLAFLMSED